VSPKAKKLSFHATKVTAEVSGEVQSLTFEVEQEGDPTVYFAMMNEGEGSIRVSWSDGKLGQDECSVIVASVALEKARFKLDYKEPDAAKVGPYKGVELTFEELDEEAAPDVAEAFAKLFGPKQVKPAYEGPRRRGTPQLGVLAASRNEWRATVGKDVPLEILISNVGGGVQGISLEIGGPAVAANQVEVREAKSQGKIAKFETKSGVARAVLEQTKVEADFDIDRKAMGKDAPPPPKFPFTVVVRGKTKGQGLLTVRVIPRTADGRGAAMVGRTIVVE
jgi:hypothetical protein